jgi:hypothetical protein
VAVRGRFDLVSTGTNPADDCNGWVGGTAGHTMWDDTLRGQDGYVMFGAGSGANATANTEEAEVIYGGCRVGRDFTNVTIEVEETWLANGPTRFLRFQAAQSQPGESLRVARVRLEVFDVHSPTPLPTPLPTPAPSVRARRARRRARVDFSLRMHVETQKLLSHGDGAARYGHGEASKLYANLRLTSSTT